VPDGGGGDDIPLGSGGTDASGNFNDGSDGIGVSPLQAGDRIYALDKENDLVGPVVTVQGESQPAPLLDSPLLLAVVLAFLVSLGMISVRKRSVRSSS
jgi:hypothetical protein